MAPTCFLAISWTSCEVSEVSLETLMKPWKTILSSQLKIKAKNNDKHTHEDRLSWPELALSSAIASRMSWLTLGIISNDFKPCKLFDLHMQKNWNIMKYMYIYFTERVITCQFVDNIYLSILKRWFLHLFSLFVIFFVSEKYYWKFYDYETLKNDYQIPETICTSF